MTKRKQHRKEVAKFMSMLFQLTEEVREAFKAVEYMPEVAEVTEDCPVEYDAYNWGDR